MRHPFANVQYYASELRFDAYDSEDPPSSSNEKSHVQRALVIPPPRRQPDLARLASHTQDAAQVVKRSRRLAVLLGGQESGPAIPTYRPGGTVNGSLAILSPSELLSVHAVVCGTASSGIDFPRLTCCRYMGTSTSAKSPAPGGP